ncbi:MAG: MBL fold metallo-hydrolase [Sandaracinus sp.]
MFRVRFWGVRGSIPTPGPDTVHFGGNTSCVEVVCGQTRIIFDAGTGLRLLGNTLVKEMPLTVHLFFSHVHWDHIQGFPFFAPAFVKGNVIQMYGRANTGSTVETALAGQMETPNFPVHLRELPAQLVFNDVHPGDKITLAPGLEVTSAQGHHPGGVFAYRVDYQGKSLVYATDTEHYGEEPDPRLVALGKEADVFVFDTMYTREEYEGKNGISKVGWGHAHLDAGLALIDAAGAKKYVLFHHDPGQSDAAVREKERRAREKHADSICAYEGLVLDL